MNAPPQPGSALHNAQMQTPQVQMTMMQQQPAYAPQQMGGYQPQQIGGMVPVMQPGQGQTYGAPPGQAQYGAPPGQPQFDAPPQYSAQYGAPR